MEYLSQQKQEWSKGYFAPNVESAVFRFYGRILSKDFAITGQQGERLLDFGCGQAAAVNYFHGLGFHAYGVDISESDIADAQQRFPHLSQQLAVIDPKPLPDQTFFGGEFECIISIQTLYYLSDDDLDVALQNLYDNMRPGGVFYASMISPQHTLYDFSAEAKGGMRRVKYDITRLGKGTVYINFMESEEDIIRRFSMFEPVHVGFYAERYRQDEGVRHHYTFVGIRK